MAPVIRFHQRVANCLFILICTLSQEHLRILVFSPLCTIWRLHSTAPSAPLALCSPALDARQRALTAARRQQMNHALSLARLTHPDSELVSLYTPLQMRRAAGDLFPFLSVDMSQRYHSTAVLACAWQSASMPMRVDAHASVTSGRSGSGAGSASGFGSSSASGSGSGSRGSGGSGGSGGWGLSDAGARAQGCTMAQMVATVRPLSSMPIGCLSLAMPLGYVSAAALANIKQWNCDALAHIFFTVIAVLSAIQRDVTQVHDELFLEFITCIFHARIFSCCLFGLLASYTAMTASRLRPRRCRTRSTICSPRFLRPRHLPRLPRPRPRPLPPRRHSPRPNAHNSPRPPRLHPLPLPLPPGSRWATTSRWPPPRLSSICRSAPRSPPTRPSRRRCTRNRCAFSYNTVHMPICVDWVDKDADGRGQ